MKTDSIFYQIFQSLPSIFFELIGEPASEASGYEFKSVEIKEIIKRIDGVFLPSKPNQPIYFAEVQFQRDEEFYYRFFTEISVYLYQYKPKRPWRAVAVFNRQSSDTEVPLEYQHFLAAGQVQRIYLSELGQAANQSVGLGMLNLIVEDETIAIDQARQLIQNAQQQEDEAFRQKVLQLIETVLVYKFPSMSRREVEAMFGLSDLKKTRYFQEVVEEAKLETVPRLLQLGLSVEQIATALELDIEVVRKAAQGESN